MRFRRLLFRIAGRAVPFGLVMLPPLFVLAQSLPGHQGLGLTPCGVVPGSNYLIASQCGLCDLGQLIQNIINFLIVLALPISAALFAWAGILLFTAGDNTGAREKAKKILKDVVIGLLIALSGYLVVQTALVTLLNPNFLSGGLSWNTLQCASDDATNSRPRNASVTQLFTGLSTGGGTLTPSGGTTGGATGGSTGTTGGTGPGPTGTPNIPTDPNIDGGVSQLNSTAPTMNTYGAICALDVRQALIAEGYTDFATTYPGSANSYGPYLTNEGFTSVAPTGYVPQTGDVAVFQGPSTVSVVNGVSSNNGHIEMYNGTEWVSDTQQSGFFPGSAWQSASYQVYRPGRSGT